MCRFLRGTRAFGQTPRRRKSAASQSLAHRFLFLTSAADCVLQSLQWKKTGNTSLPHWSSIRRAALLPLSLHSTNLRGYISMRMRKLPHYRRPLISNRSSQSCELLVTHPSPLFHACWGEKLETKDLVLIDHSTTWAFISPDMAEDFVLSR